VNVAHNLVFSFSLFVFLVVLAKSIFMLAIILHFFSNSQRFPVTNMAGEAKGFQSGLASIIT
jgi:hypothetical protein